MSKSIYEKMYATFSKLFPDENSIGTSDSAQWSGQKTLFNFLLAGIAFCATLLIINGVIAIMRTDHNAGQFGDFFGGIANPILTFLNFFALSISIVLQRTDLRLSREEFQRSSSAQETQAIENTIFNLLNLQNSILENIEFRPSDLPESIHENMRKTQATKGRRAFTSLCDLLSKCAEIATSKATNPQDPREPKRIITESKRMEIQTKEIADTYRKIQNSNNEIFGHYFRNLYQMLKFLDTYPKDLLSDVEKTRYARIIRAQLSSSELTTLMLNCVCPLVDNGEFRNLVIKYEMLEHAPIKAHEGNYKISGHESYFFSQSDIGKYEQLTESQSNLAASRSGAFGTRSPRTASITS